MLSLACFFGRPDQTCVSRIAERRIFGKRMMLGLHRIRTPDLTILAPESNQQATGVPHFEHIIEPTTVSEIAVHGTLSSRTIVLKWVKAILRAIKASLPV